ncbi:NAD-dependent protein deacylase sirtuin-5, mitochondrial, partial [Ilyodon furcidens]
DPIQGRGGKTHILTSWLKRLVVLILVRQFYNLMIVRRFACRVINTHLYAWLRKPWRIQAMARPSSDLAAFRKVFSKSNNIAIITGAGVSAESGVPTFRGAGGYWRKWQAQ